MDPADRGSSLVREASCRRKESATGRAAGPEIGQAGGEAGAARAVTVASPRPMDGNQLQRAPDPADRDFAQEPDPMPV